MCQQHHQCSWTDYLEKEVKIKIDRTLGSLHPKWKFRYEVNYGFVPGVISGDGEELDSYVLGVDEPLKEFTGICIAIIQRLTDDDDKLIVVPKGIVLTDKEIMEKVNFQEQFFKSRIIRKTQQ